MSMMAVHCWYIKDAFAEFCHQIFEQNISDDLLGKIDKKFVSSQYAFGYQPPSSKTPPPFFC